MGKVVCTLITCILNKKCTMVCS